MESQNSLFTSYIHELNADIFHSESDIWRCGKMKTPSPVFKLFFRLVNCNLYYTTEENRSEKRRFVKKRSLDTSYWQNNTRIMYYSFWAEFISVTQHPIKNQFHLIPCYIAFKFKMYVASERFIPCLFLTCILMFQINFTCNFLRSAIQFCIGSSNYRSGK